MRRAAARAASRRGSSRTILPVPSQDASSSASGTSVVLPAPGGATSTALLPAPSASLSAGSTADTGSSGRFLLLIVSTVGGQALDNGIAARIACIGDESEQDSVRHVFP